MIGHHEKIQRTTHLGFHSAMHLDSFAFGDITGYVNVPPADYDIRVVPESTGVTAINVEGLTLTPGLVATAIARQPDGDGVPADFALQLLTN